MGSSCQCRTVAVNDSKRHCQEKKYDGKTQWWCLVVDIELTGWVLIQNSRHDNVKFEFTGRA